MKVGQRLRQPLRHIPFNLFLTLLWVLLSDNYSLPSLVTGYVVGYLLIAVLPSPPLKVDGLRLGRLHVHIFLLAIFFKEMVVANFQVAAQVLRPRLNIRPGIIAYPLRVRGPLKITALASLISLTPGTLSVDVSADKKTLFIHCIDASDPEAALKAPRQFEDLVEEVWG